MKFAVLTLALALCFFTVATIPATAQILQAVAGPSAVDNTLAADSTSESVLIGDPAAEPEPKSSSASDQYWQDPNGLKVSIYPILAMAPVFGANVRVPDTPSTPGGGSGSTNSSFNGAALFGFNVQKGHWYFDGDGMWAGMSASKSNPHLKVDVNAVYGHGQVGYKFYKDFYFTGGFRRMGLRYDINLGDFPTFHRTPGIWDPLVGILWNRQLSKKWNTKVNVEGGGFGVGADVDFSATATADWQFAKHFGLEFGYGLIKFDVSDTVLSKTLTVNQTLNGPIFGFGIYF